MPSPRPFDTGTGLGPASGSGPLTGPHRGSGPDSVSGSGTGPGPGSSSAPERRRAMELLARVRYGRLATSMRALPLLAVARHQVVEGRVLLRMHRGLGYHESCDGSVIAYGADNFDSAPAPGDPDGLWSVHFTGPAELTDPAPGERALFGAEPSRVNGEPFDPVYIRLEPHVVRMHTLGFGASP
ncbi:pyridoxamine 5'-phosphate oxidase family protein [Streptomyces halstedii]|uniref:Pyridoxamine 5'-phosphate oxidase family protein n=2 Tax=Streptomyces halstedii TaxID=1944 RepID=A0ABS6TNK4_STRHA|nr:pyridoxamine 5'-phosphate oxidase family protein [Streptomyces halstedii]